MLNALRVGLLLCLLMPTAALAGASPPGPDAMPKQSEAAAPPPRQTAPPGTYRMPSQPAAAPQPTEAAPAANPPPPGEETEEAQKPAFVLPAPPETGIKNAEQARLRLQDICMYASVAPDAPEGVSAPRCACYAQTLAKTLTPDDIAGFAANDEMPEGVRERASAIWERCKSARN